MFKILAITFGGISWGALSGWMSKSVLKSPRDSVFVRNNLFKVKIKTNWKSSLISILQERNQKGWSKLLSLYSWVVTRLKRVWFTNYWLQIFASFIRRRFHVRSVANSLIRYLISFQLNVLASFKYKLLFRKSYWFPSWKKLNICQRHNSFKPFHTLMVANFQ